MSQTKAVADAVYESISRLPAELCRLTAEYVERPHVWTGIDSAVTVSSSADGCLTRIVDSIPNCIGWRRLVSANAFGTAHLRWFVDFSCRTTACIFIAAGITCRTANSTIPSARYDDVADVGDWMLLYYSHNEEFQMVHNNIRTIITQLPTVKPAPNKYCYRLAFAVDPSTGNVVAQLFQAIDDGDLQRIVVGASDILLYSAANRPDWRRLRPCIVSYGPIDATISSS